MYQESLKYNVIDVKYRFSVCYTYVPLKIRIFNARGKSIRKFLTERGIYFSGRLLWATALHRRIKWMNTRKIRLPIQDDSVNLHRIYSFLVTIAFTRRGANLGLTKSAGFRMEQSVSNLLILIAIKKCCVDTKLLKYK